MFDSKNLKSFHEKLEKIFEKKLILSLKDNKSTIMSFLKEKNFYRLNLHKAFISAPTEVLKSIKRYLLQKDRDALVLIRKFIKNYFLKQKRSYKKKLQTKGEVYDLEKIFFDINKKYFFSKIKNLKICWFEKPKYKKCRKITFGRYFENFRLIKINKILDNKNIPYYFISFIIYHEILHDIYPVDDSKYRRVIHTKEFKKAEKRFLDYEKAINFKNQGKLWQDIVNGLI